MQSLAPQHVLQCTFRDALQEKDCCVQPQDMCTCLLQVQSLRQAECEEVAVTDASTGAHTVSATSSASVFGSTAGETIAACAEAQPQARMVLVILHTAVLLALLHAA